MNREEAKMELIRTKRAIYMYDLPSEAYEAIDMAIEALSAEAVSREAIMSAKFHPLPYTHITPTDADAESYKRGWNDALDAVADNAPSAEAVMRDATAEERASVQRYIDSISTESVKVVRCKDCRYYKCGVDLCESLGDDGFCSWGERKGGEADD